VPCAVGRSSGRHSHDPATGTVFRMPVFHRMTCEAMPFVQSFRHFFFFFFSSYVTDPLVPSFSPPSPTYFLDCLHFIWLYCRFMFAWFSYSRRHVCVLVENILFFFFFFFFFFTAPGPRRGGVIVLADLAAPAKTTVFIDTVECMTS
jgi:hypothetical protein